MITTEREAKRKWCPLIRVHSASGGFNVKRDTIGDEIKSRIKKVFLPRWYLDFKYKCYRCRASGCMSWRWVDKTHGFCGQFGSPDAGALADNPYLLAPPAPVPRTNGSSRAGDAALPFIVMVSMAVIAFFVWPLLR